MLFEFRLPDIGEGIAEGELVSWFVSPGQLVAEDQPLFEVMTDKVSVDIPSPKAGRVIKLCAKAGELVPVGSVLLTLELEGAETLVSGEITSRQTPLKAPCPLAAAVTQEQAQGLLKETPALVLAAPATRALAREQGVALQSVVATGSYGRITQKDVLMAASSSLQALPSPNVAAPFALAPQPQRLPERPKSLLLLNKTVNTAAQTLPYNGVRRATGQQMQLSHAVPTFALIDTLEVSELVALRERLKPWAQAKDVKLTYLPFVLKAVAEALQQVPELNAALNEKAGVIQRFGEVVNLSIAIDTPQGLLVPVLNDVANMSLKTVAQELQSLVQKAINGVLTSADMQGGTFTVTSLGQEGGLLGVPMINPPQAGILGVHAMKKRPVVKPDDTLGIGMEMNLSLSADHRVVDGRHGAAFLGVIRRLLEQPESLLLL
jgi:pyruvate dehydrogenase E2 component (dihydrolipoamide acetyltransferase)